MSNIMMYTKGAKDALNNLEKYLTESINRNGGVQTPQQAVAVLNDTIYYLHKEIQSIPDEKSIDGVAPSEEELMRMLTSGLFGNMEIQIVKGGIL